MNMNTQIMIYEDEVFLLNARLYARAAHAAVGQRRKYTDEPYVNHVLEVSNTVLDDVIEAGKIDLIESLALISSALLHDVVEDTAVTINDIRETFGNTVAKLVSELTAVYTSKDFPSMSRRERKAAEAERLAEVSNNAKTIKLADILSNTKDIVEHDPMFATVYLAEKAALLPLLKGGSPRLYARVENQLADAVEKLRVRKT